MTHGTSLTYNGQQVATVTKVERHGINYAVTYSTGYVAVLPASAMAPDLLAMVDE